eukprot:jgi/Chlat1/6126/Chrsp409S05667
MSLAMDVRKAAEALFARTEESVVMAVKVAKHSIKKVWGSADRVQKRGAAPFSTRGVKPRVLCLTLERSKITRGFKTRLHVLKGLEMGQMEIKMTWKLKHLMRVEGAQGGEAMDNSFVLVFELARYTQVCTWIAQSPADRFNFLGQTAALCREHLSKVPAVDGGADTNATQAKGMDGTNGLGAIDDTNNSNNKSLVSAAEEKDFQTLLGMYAMGIGEAEAFTERLGRELSALVAANVHTILESQPLVNDVLEGFDAAFGELQDLEEWLSVFQVKLTHMRQDIATIEAMNNKLELQARNSGMLADKLSELLQRLTVSNAMVDDLTKGSLDDERRLSSVVRSARALHTNILALEPQQVGDKLAGMRAVRERRVELENLRDQFARRAVAFLKAFISDLTDEMLANTALLPLSPASLPPLRRLYAASVNALLRRETRDYVGELRATAKGTASNASMRSGGSGGGRHERKYSFSDGGSDFGSGAGSSDGYADAYVTLLRTLLPCLRKDAKFFLTFLPTDNNTLNNTTTTTTTTNNNKREVDSAVEALLSGVQEDIFYLLDIAARTDPLQCISMLGETEAWQQDDIDANNVYLTGVLTECQTKLKLHFNKFIDDMAKNIAAGSSLSSSSSSGSAAKKLASGSLTLPAFAKFGRLVRRMEELAEGRPRDVVDAAYYKLAGALFQCLDRAAAADPKRASVLQLQNYGVFLAGVGPFGPQVPALAKYLQTARDGYQSARTAYIQRIIYKYFGKLFEFGDKLDSMMQTITPEEVPFQMGYSKQDMRKTTAAAMSNVQKGLMTMSKKMAKHFGSGDDHTLSLLWKECEASFMKKYEHLEDIVALCYSGENLRPSGAEIRETFKAV